MTRLAFHSNLPDLLDFLPACLVNQYIPPALLHADHLLYKEVRLDDLILIAHIALADDRIFKEEPALPITFGSVIYEYEYP